MAGNLVRKIRPNRNGEDWLVGDIHGNYTKLEAALDDVGFDPESDRLFCTGDLIDRGPESIRASEFLDKPWFFSVRGNHDMLLVHAVLGLLKGKLDLLDVWDRCGGLWRLDHDWKSLGKLANQILDCSIAFEWNIDGRRIGLMHAEPPIGGRWPHFLPLDEKDLSKNPNLLWNRDRILALERGAMQHGIAPDRWVVNGIDQVVVGHTPMPKPMWIANVYFIDTISTGENESFHLVRLMDLAASSSETKRF